MVFMMKESEIIFYELLLKLKKERDDKNKQTQTKFNEFVYF